MAATSRRNSCRARYAVTAMTVSRSGRPVLVRSMEIILSATSVTGYCGLMKRMLFIRTAQGYIIMM